MADFLWHKIDEKEKKQILEKSKQVMDEFSKELERVDKIDIEPFIEKGLGERREGIEEDLNFNKEIMFENAPEKNKDFIIAEKKSWEDA